MSSPTIDLTNCDQEPIHQPGAIQPHGVLIVCRADTLVITHASDNLERLCGIAATAAIGQRIGVLFPQSHSTAWEQHLISEARGARPFYLFSLRIKGVSRSFDAIAHRSGELIFVELEPADRHRDHSAPELYRLVQRATSRVQQALSVDELARACVNQVRQICGFDRVMAYRVDDDWNGQVIAEEKRDDLEPFLGLHYPASDIPQQARELYTKNWLRFIANRDYTPSRLVPEVHAQATEPLDMSFSVLRSVSPIHLEYLRNMGVWASMSISLLRNGRLWGLIACHHYQPRFVPYDVRTACELLGQFMSLSLAAAEDRERLDYRNSSRACVGQMITNIERSEDTARALLEQQPNLLSLIKADGAAVIVGDEISRLGQTPGEADLRRLSEWLHGKEVPLFATDQLTKEFGSGVLGTVASGILAVSLTASRPHQFIWFRPEQIRTVDWAGDPQKSLQKGDGAARLSPRGSFALWKETIRGRSAPWLAVEVEAAELLRDRLATLIIRRTELLATANSDLRLANAEREKALDSERAARVESERMHRMKDEFVATLSHELRTPLNAILGWSQLLARHPGLDAELIEGLEVIERNARAQAQLIEDLIDTSRIISGKLRLNLQDMQLPSIVEGAITSVSLAAQSRGVRIERMIDSLDGVRITGDPQRLQQVVWNVLSNAVKFTPRGGKVQVILERVASHIELTVTDTGQGIDPAFLPYVFDRFRQADSSMSRGQGGLGLGLSIVKHLVELHGGAVQAHSRGTGHGATFVISLPLRAVTQGDSPGNEHPAHPLDCDDFQLDGVRVLVLDDETDARNLVHRILEGCRCVVFSAGTADAALELLEQQSVDVIVSDIGMPEMDGYQFIQQWRKREATLQRSKAPAVALTAYARTEDRRRALLAGFQSHVAKPVDGKELLTIVASLIGRV